MKNGKKHLQVREIRAIPDMMMSDILKTIDIYLKILLRPNKVMKKIGIPTNCLRVIVTNDFQTVISKVNFSIKQSRFCDQDIF